MATNYPISIAGILGFGGVLTKKAIQKRKTVGILGFGGGTLKRKAVQKRKIVGSMDAPATWVPTNIGGCVLWLRSDLEVTHDGSPTYRISLEKDQSGNGNNFAQADNDKKFIWTDNQLDGQPAIFSDGLDDIELCINSLSLSALSVFFVGKRVGDGTIFSYGVYPPDYTHSYGYTSAAGGYSTYVATDLLAGNNIMTGVGTVLFDVYHCGIERWAGGGNICTFFLNGEEKTVTGENLHAVPAPAQLGLASNGYTIGSHWRVEIALYNNVISAGDVAKLWDYAKKRYPSLSP